MADSDGIMYCPMCGRWLEAINREEVASGEHLWHAFLHDDVPHSDEDLEALEHGIN